MGRPVNKHFFGDPNATGRTFPAITMSSAWMSGQNAVSTNPVYILRQTGTARFLVTDGTITGTVRLMPSVPANPGEGTILVTPFIVNPESGANFTFTYKVLSATVGSSGGTGYNVNDVITMTNGTTLTVSTVNAGAVTAVTVSAPGSRGTVSNATSTNVAQTSVAPAGGTGATFNLNFGLNTASVSGGTGYTAGESVTFVGMTATTMPTATITGVNGSGTPSGVTIGSAGSGITVSATSGSGSFSVTQQFARTIKNRSVRTFEGNTFAWDPFNAATQTNQANLPTSGTASELTTYNLGNQAALAGALPNNLPSYGSNINSGATPLASNVFASGGTPGGNGNAARPRTVAFDGIHPMGVGRTMNEDDTTNVTGSTAQGRTNRTFKKTTDKSKDKDAVRDATKANTSEPQVDERKVRDASNANTAQDSGDKKIPPTGSVKLKEDEI